MSHRRREERESERICVARAAAGSAMDAALAQIGAAFDQAAAINRFKLRVEYFIRFGPPHPPMRARVGARPRRLRGPNLDPAIAAVTRWWRDELKAFQIASALGGGNRLSLEVLNELRLLLRLMRFKRMAVEFGAIIAALCEEPL